jgi:hypothetical protein
VKEKKRKRKDSVVSDDAASIIKAKICEEVAI